MSGMTPMEQTWLPHLRELCDSIRSSVSAAMARQNPAELSRILGQGAGDISFGIDAPAERAADAWLERHARRGPVSLLTEESGTAVRARMAARWTWPASTTGGHASASTPWTARAT